MQAGNGTQPRDDAGPPPNEDGILAVYLGTFAPRTDIHNIARAGNYVIPKSHGSAQGCTGRDDDECDPEPLTTGIVWRALRQRGAVGAYHPGADGSTHIGAIDVDRDDGMTVARAIATQMGAHGVRAYIEPSRDGQRAHLWVPGPVLPARVWTLALLAAVNDAGHRADTAGELAREHDIELRPDGSGGYGKALRLPGMTHPVTGTRFPLLAPDGGPLGDGKPGHVIDAIAEWMGAIEPASVDGIIALAERAPQPKPEPIRPTRSRRRDDDEPDILAILAALGVQNPQPGRSVKCPFHGDRRASMSIARDGLRVWCHAPACIVHADGRGMGPRDLAQMLAGAA